MISWFGRVSFWKIKKQSGIIMFLEDCMAGSLVCVAPLLTVDFVCRYAAFTKVILLDIHCFLV